MPPVAADGAAAGVLAILEVHEFIDMEVALQDDEDIVLCEESGYFEELATDTVS